jgi:hypothetical protein
MSEYEYSTGSEVQPELLSGETVIWCGKPERRVIFHKQDLFVIPFSLLWGGFAIFWEWGASGHFAGKSDTLFFSLWGIPFVIMGQYFIWGRFFYTAWRKGNTYYAVTNKRVLVINKGWSRKVTDGYIRNLDSVSLTTRSDGLGTIEFAPDPAASRPTWGRSSRKGYQMDIDLSRLAFFDIDDARTVYQAIQAQRQNMSSEVFAPSKA